MGDGPLVAWLLDSDPSLRWQVERDVVHAPRETWEATRARIATEGFGARLLALQDDDGQWAGGAFFPAGFEDDAPHEAGQPWTATTWCLVSLREWGMDPAPLRERRTAELIARNSRWEYDDLPYWGGEVDCCINAYTLANGAWLGADVAALREEILRRRLADGGWNCDWVDGSVRSSFPSTLNTVKGLLAYEELVGGDGEVRAARHAGEEYLLERRLFRRASTGEVAVPWALRLTYPFRGIYSVLNALAHFRIAALADGTAPDPRLAEAVDHVRAARRPDGTWLQEGPPAGRVWFDEDVPAGEPSPWLTLHATRVLAWWDGAELTPPGAAAR